MKLIIEIPDELFSIFKKHGINAFDYFDEYDKDQIAIAIAHGKPYEPIGDCISREALKEQVKNEVCEVCFDSPDERQCSPNCKLCTFKQLIDNAPTVDIKDQIAGAYNEGFMCGNREAEKARPQGEWVSKRLWDNTHIWVCSECGNQNTHGITVEKACWKCGADMRKGGAE